MVAHLFGGLTMARAEKANSSDSEGVRSETAAQPKRKKGSANAKPAAAQGKADREAQESAKKQTGRPKKAKKEPPRLEFRGRTRARAVFQRQAAALLGTQTQIDSFDLSVPEARVGVRYRSPLTWLIADLEVDVVGKFTLKDAFLQARSRHWVARAGQFKMPGPAIETESIWKLPLAHRDFLSEILVDRLEVAGRRPGVAVTARDWGGVRPELTVGVSQGSYLSDEQTRETEWLEAQTTGAQNWVARAGVDLSGVELGLYYESRVGTPRIVTRGSETTHYSTVGADLVLDRVLRHGGWRVWLDGITGASWYEHPSRVADSKDATFAAGRALVAYRHGGVEPERFYVESYGLAGVLDPDLGVKSDLAWEAAVGINVGTWQRARFTLQGEVAQVLHNFPRSYVLEQTPERRALMAQVGIAF